LQFLAKNIIIKTALQPETKDEGQIYSISLVRVCDLISPLGFILLASKSKIIQKLFKTYLTAKWNLH